MTPEYKEALDMLSEKGVENCPEAAIELIAFLIAKIDKLEEDNEYLWQTKTG